MTTYYTPAVKAEARNRGIDLETIKGTGTAGRVTVNDVRAAARSRAPYLRPAVAVSLPAGAGVVNRRSVFNWHTFVDVDEYAPNPVADEMRQVQPERYAAASSVSRPPTLFESGDLPIYTAAGFSVSLLAAVPWPARHRIARLDHIPASQLLNELTPGPASDPVKLAVDAFELFHNDEENRDYVTRMHQWLENATVFDSLRGWQPNRPIPARQTR